MERETKLYIIAIILTIIAISIILYASFTDNSNNGDEGLIIIQEGNQTYIINDSSGADGGEGQMYVMKDDGNLEVVDIENSSASDSASA